MKKNKLLFIVIITIMLNSSFSNAAIHLTEEYIDSNMPGYTKIYTLEDLNNIRNNLSGNYILMNDLDFNSDSSYSNIANKAMWTTGEGWAPIGVDNCIVGVTFSGILDGNGYVIKNLYINRPTVNQVGIFRSVSGCTVKNIGFENINLTSASGTGAIAGAANHITVDSVYVTGKTDVIRDTDYSWGSLLIGKLIGNSNISNCYAIGTTSHNFDFLRTGLLIGEKDTNTKVRNCYVIGETNGSGGIAGVSYNDGTEIKNCIAMVYKTNSVRISNGTEGFINNYGYIYTRNVTLDRGLATLNGADITYQQFKDKAFYTNVANWDVSSLWDFENVWELRPGAIRPTLRAVGEDMGGRITLEPIEDLTTYRGSFKYYVGKDHNNVVKIMLVSGDGKSVPSRGDILDADNKFKLGIHFIDKDGKVKIY